MQITQREYNILQICFDIKDYICSYREDILERILKLDGVNSNYDIVMTFYRIIAEDGANLCQLKKELTEVLEYDMDELVSGTLDLNFGRELSLVSRILYELENINWVPTREKTPMPEFAAKF